MKAAAVFLGGIAVLGISSFAAGGQETSAPGPVSSTEQDPYVLRSTVRQVPVDVVVLDKNGNPVSGLRSDDFAIEEDGKVQHILSFDRFDGSGSGFTPPKIPALPPNTYVDIPDVPERGPLYVLYYDMVNSSEDDQGTFRAELLKFVDHAAPGARIALFVNARGLHLVQGFTADHRLLREAILRKGPPPTVPEVFLYGNVFGRYDVGAALSNLNFIAEYLAGMPERKNLIWMASYFPIPVGVTLVGLDRTLPSSPAPKGGVGGLGGPQTLDLTELEAQAIKNTYASMMRSRVALYPVDISGIAGGGDASVNRQNLDSIAAATGGHAYYSDNHPALLIDKAVAHGSSYYTLSYSPSNTNFDGAERKIHVELNAKNKNYSLTYRTLYYAVSDADAQSAHAKQVTQQRFLAAKAADTLYATAEHGAPMAHDLLFVARLSTAGQPRMATQEQMRSLEDSPAYFRTRKRNQTAKPLTPVKLQKYVINYDVIDPQLRAQAQTGQKSTVLEFAAAAYNSEGTLLNSILNEGSLSSERRSDGQLENHFRAVQQLEVPPGAAFIRVVVRNKENDRSGALEVSLPLKPETQTADLDHRKPADSN